MSDILKLALRYDVLFGLGFNIAEDSSRPSGFKPAYADESREPLYANIRLDGFAAALRVGFAKRLVVVSGDAKYLKEPQNQAAVIRRMLVMDCDIAPERVVAVRSEKSTGGNIAAIKNYLADHDLIHERCAVMSNAYHLLRAPYDLAEQGLSLRCAEAEALWVLEGAFTGSPTDTLETRRFALPKRLAGVENRIAMECAGIARKVGDLFENRPPANLLRA